MMRSRSLPDRKAQITSKTDDWNYEITETTAYLSISPEKCMSVMINIGFSLWRCRAALKPSFSKLENFIYLTCVETELRISREPMRGGWSSCALLAVITKPAVCWRVVTTTCPPRVRNLMWCYKWLQWSFSLVIIYNAQPP